MEHLAKSPINLAPNLILDRISQLDKTKNRLPEFEHLSDSTILSKIGFSSYVRKKSIKNIDSKLVEMFSEYKSYTFTSILEIASKYCLTLSKPSMFKINPDKDVASKVRGFVKKTNIKLDRKDFYLLAPYEYLNK